MDFAVRLYDIFPATIEAIDDQGGIRVDGVVQGFGKLELATLDIAAAIHGADIVMVVAPAVAHRAIAESCAPHLTEGQVVFVHPGATGGALEFHKILHDAGAASVTVAEANSLIYACRCPTPGQATIFGIKKQLMVAALPSRATATVVAMLQHAFPQIYAGRNVFDTSLGNPNAMMHPAPTLLNTSLIESEREWLYYWDGVTPSVGALVEQLDAERLALGQALGLEMPGIREWYQLAYGVSGDTLSDAVQQNRAYAQVKGQKTLRTRYLLEDVPTGLVPMASLGRLLGVPVRKIETIIHLAEMLLGEDLTSDGRTMENLGLADMTVSQLQTFIESGERA